MIQQAISHFTEALYLTRSCCSAVFFVSFARRLRFPEGFFL